MAIDTNADGGTKVYADGRRYVWKGTGKGLTPISGRLEGENCIIITGIYNKIDHKVNNTPYFHFFLDVHSFPLSIRRCIVFCVNSGHH